MYRLFIYGSYTAYKRFEDCKPLTVQDRKTMIKVLNGLLRNGYVLDTVIDKDTGKDIFIYRSVKTRQVGGEILV
jgi:orotate phosphoribosyltransferase-like protein